jgi:hypothetical protein
MGKWSMKGKETATTSHLVTGRSGGDGGRGHKSGECTAGGRSA